MMRRFAWAFLLLAPLAAHAGAPPDEVLDAMERWTDTAMTRLALPDGPPPARVVMESMDVARYRAVASFGALVSETKLQERPARVEVLVGNDTLNSSRFAVTNTNLPVVRVSSLSIDPAQASHDRDLWFSIDRAYKAAVARLQVKIAAMSALGGDPPPPEWSPAPVVTSITPHTTLFPDVDALRDLVLGVSARLRTVDGLRDSAVSVHAVDATTRIVTSEGTRIIQPDGYAVVFAWAEAARADGVVVGENQQWVAATAADLPSADVLNEAVEALGRRVVARLSAHVVDAWEGPVVFEGNAAADFFRYLAVPEIRGTPPVPEPNRTWQALTRDGPRLGRHLLPPGWTVSDDPTRSFPGLPGGYSYDREGVRGEPVSLVQDGYVRGLLMTRVPRKEIQRSNGHARGGLTDDWTARPSIWEVQPPHTLKRRAFDREVDRSVKEADLDRVLVIRSLLLGREGALPRPGDAAWVFPDGHEEPVLSLQFQKVDRRTLRDVVAAGGAQRPRAYLDAWSAGRGADTDSGIPCVAVTPERILVTGMEAVFPGPDEKPPSYPRPGVR